MADSAKIDAARLTLFCKQHGTEPGLRQLLAFQRRLCTVGTEESGVEAIEKTPTDANNRFPGEVQEMVAPMAVVR